MPKIISTRKSLRSAEYHEHKKRESRFRGLLLLLGGLLLFVIPVFLLRLERFRVSEIIVSGNVVVSQEEVKAQAQEILDETYLWLLPKDNDLLVPKKKLRETIQREIPRVGSTKVSLQDTRTLKIEIQEREPVALYCRELENDLASNCFLLDKTGFIFAKAPAFSGEVYFIYTGGDMEEPVGNNFLQEEQFSLVREFIDKTEELGLIFKSFEFKPEEPETRAQFQLRSVSRTVVFWYAEEALENIYSSLATLVVSGALGGESTPLDAISYLDLTIPNKPYWKSR